MDIIIKKLTEEDIDKMGIKSWPIWIKEVSRFDWYYDSQEQCLFLEGKVTIHTDKSQITIGKGDFVTFPKGLKCVWQVLEPVKKHYNFE